MHVLVTGAAGYIGSIVAEVLIARGHTVSAYDDLSEGHRDAVPDGAAFFQGDLLDRARLDAVLREARPDAVVHMAAVCQVGESVADPAKYYRVNVLGGLTLLDALRAAGVARLVFSSTAAVYGEPAKQPIEEDDPTAPSNPYGDSKLALERALGWYGGAYGLRAVSLRYFNAAGASARAGERHSPETHLIPIVLQAAAGRRAGVTIYGDDYPTRDGTCLRDYVHVCDLADAHVRALAYLDGGGAPVRLNLGSGTGTTVREVIASVARVTEREVPHTDGPRRPGDPSSLVASAAGAEKILGWRPQRGSIDTIVEDAWRWHRRLRA